MIPVHPDAALFAGEKPFPVIAACEHFAGSEKLILKALEQMEKLGPVFQIPAIARMARRPGANASTPR